VESAPVDVELIVNRNGGRIRGTVETSREGEPGLISMVLVPAVPRLTNPTLYKFDLMSPDGSFVFSGVAPGAYKLFAFEVFPRGAEQDPEFMAQYEQRGVLVTAKAGTQTDVLRVPIIRPK
jgi:hypothetical protein